MATLTTVKARAFRDGWTPSPIASTTFFFEYGTLQPPVATPGSGTYPPDQLVSLAAEPDTTIRYTLDGSDPNADSTAYTAPLTLPTGLVTLKARAFRTDWTPSAVASWTYQITTDVTPPTITADVSPPPNGAGWYETDVTVSFTCSDAESGIATCD